jgi:hypothetical protein
MEEGPQEAFFDASRCASGVYFYRISADAVPDEDAGVAGARFSAVRKMIVLK